MKFIVEDNVRLLEFLSMKINNKSKNAIKSLLLDRCVLVNNKVITKYNYNLKLNDIVQIIKKINKNMEIIYEDKDIIVINKPCGLLTIGTNKVHDKTLYRYTSDYLKKINKNSKIFIVHRLDKDTSGIVVFAKNKDIKDKLQNNWNEIATRKYIAVVFGKMLKCKGTIKTYIKENPKTYKSFSSKTGELAITNYKVLSTNSKYSLLDIEIKTGKKNQIRVHLSELGNPIVGDKKYGNSSFPFLCLHAYELTFNRNINNKDYCFKTGIPEYYNKLIDINDFKI
ncbi:MAG: RluA family pseudouridine synthase [Clostridium sp.]|nr:RluA family pseudouridine synthase [Clostridium sp.]MCM1443926.1 RluA family pseudouridine synthase [Candidatus Amulumruptor caecigallinarius]